MERSTQLQQTEMLTTYLLHCWAARRSWKGLAYSTVSILPRTSDWCNWESAYEVSWITLFEAEGWTSPFIYHVQCRVLFIYIPYICILIIFFLFFLTWVSQKFQEEIQYLKKLLETLIWIKYRSEWRFQLGVPRSYKIGPGCSSSVQDLATFKLWAQFNNYNMQTTCII